MKRNMVCVLLLLLAVTRPAAAQAPAVVSGRVVSGPSGAPEAGVLVRIEALNAGAATGADGRYRLVVPAARVVPGDSVTLVASRTGLAQESRRVVLAHGAETVADFALAPLVIALEDVVVAGASGDVSVGLAGKVAGVTVANVPAGRGERGDGSGGDPSGDAAGVLTAGVWDDLADANWRAYRRFLRREQQAGEQWQVKPEQVLRIRFRGGRAPLRDHLVTVEQDGHRFQARTDGDGMVRLLPTLAHHRLRPGTFTVTPQGGSPRRLRYAPESVRRAGRSRVLQVRQPIAAAAPRPVLDIGFMIDATGSMQDELHFLQTELRDIIARVQPRRGELDIRISIVFYRDRGDEFVTRVHAFGDDVDATVAFLDRTRAGGGGDFPEEMNEAFRVMMSQAWSLGPAARMLFVVADAPPHPYPDARYTYHDAMAEASRRGISIFPVAASGIDRPTEYLMRAMAVATGGKYIFLTDDSGVGNPHLTPEVDYDVERLNDLMVREIRNFAALHYPQLGRIPARRVAVNR